ncbi:RsmB/NOP family class I SAM-dependent RNA methyltransferase [Canibacter oris]|uniref:16S rRNA (Cytosine967-C5)-methyltransferase n=1 Tax=Canibacter oris TaxID=1365628 RepID=A0A840DFU5_9MICO|nr:transcription antitermination factor NusB [Canibacter oris]MBB4071924.1 16S rRNA (cytosine967-C5)-methyltransferase [Canibacter oris]
MANKVAATRLLAYDVLRDVADRDAYANLALQARIHKQKLSGRDAAFVTELVSQTLRLQGKYDAIISAAAGRDTAEIDARTLRVLRLGAHQLLGMRVPQHAALHETVELQRLVANPKAAGFVNAVLRKISKRSLAGWETEIIAGRSVDQTLAVRHSHPEWIVRSLRDALKSAGRAEQLEELLAADNEPPQVQLMLLPRGFGATDKDALTDDAPATAASDVTANAFAAEFSATLLREKALAAIPEHLSPSGPSPYGVALSGMQPASVIKQLAAAGVTARVQDQGSQLAALTLIAAKPLADTETWLDLCAGPGGKTAVLAAFAAAATPRRISLRANEVAPHRAKLVERAVAEAGSAAVAHTTVVNHDGTTAAAFGEQLFDRILVDAPCSGLGALRRRPEARWRKQPGDIPALVKLQEQLLQQAASQLAAGGVLAYVTCSPHLAETKAVVQRLLRRDEQLRLLDTAAVFAAIQEQDTAIICENTIVGDTATTVNSGSTLQLWPHANGTDAMFIALLQRS